MKFIANKSTLLDALSNVGKCVPSSAVLPIIECFLLTLQGGVLTITGTDLGTSMITKITVESNDEGKAVIPSKLLVETLKSLPDQPVSLTFDTAQLRLEIKAGAGVYTMSTVEPADFPKMPEIDNAVRVDLPASALEDAVSTTIFAVGKDELRPYLTGIYCQINEGELSLVATDAQRLSKYVHVNMSHQHTADFILPKKALSLLTSSLPDADIQVAVHYNKSNAFFQFVDTTIICRLIDERYPDYQSIIPLDNTNSLIIDRVELLGSLNRLINFANKTTFQVKLDLSLNKLNVSSEDADYANAAHETLDCKYNGEDMTIGFNARYLTDMLKNLDSEQIELSMSTPNKACLVLPVSDQPDTKVTMLIMPQIL